ncbi:MAG: hypothetical protein AMK69_26865 [Nitrospira bacterium SG8_3]|nr:MAG: hypothetical protein AMK69_26865 [Nitrospira bacterium SG8_3]
MAASEQRWRTLLENIELLVVGVDAQGNVNYVNPFFERTTGWDSQDIIGKSWFDTLVPEEERTERRGLFEGVKDQEQQVNVQNHILTRDGKPLTVSWSIVMLRDGDGRSMGVLSVGADVSKREELFREIALLKDRLEEENIYLQTEIALAGVHTDIIGRSDGLRYALTRVEQVAPTDTTVFLLGETGVGKELFAREIHMKSTRRDRPLIRLNCATIPHNLMESELFGHERGAFTGADKQRKGRFELADGGTIFLDEIGELPLELQPKLLRILEEGEFERLGSTETLRVNTRIIASTNRDIEAEVERGGFRRDLFYRLSMFPISIPPLRKRREDIPLLVHSFVELLSRKLGKKIETIPRDTIDRLAHYHWPGNVRELRNVIEQAIILSKGIKLTVPKSLLGGQVAADDRHEEDLRKLAEVEREHITKILDKANWRIEGKDGAADVLGLHPNTLRNRLVKFGIKRPPRQH